MVIPNLAIFPLSLGSVPVAACLLLATALPLLAQEDSSVTLLNAGNTLRDSIDYPGAIDRYRRALNHNPNNVEALLQLSFAYVQTANFDRSLDAALHGARLQSDRLPQFNALVALNYNYAIIISEYYENLVARHDSEIVEFRTFNRSQPNGASKIFGLGLTYWNMGRYPIAEECLKESMELDTALSDAPFVLGLLLLQQGRYHDANVMLQNFLQRDPESFLAARVHLLLENIRRKEEG